MDRLTAMTVFTRVVATGSFSQAAKRLNMSPAAVTNHIQALETHLNIQLLNRTTRKLGLTEAGAAFYERSLQILAELEEAENEASALQRSPKGVLRLNTSVGLADPVAPLIAAFMSRYPEVTIDLTITERMIDLIGDGFDLAIRAEPLPDSRLIARRLRTSRYMLVAAPAYLEARGTPQRPADLAAHNCLHYGREQTSWRFTGAAGAETVAVSGTFHANSANVLRIAALHGHGIALLSRYFIEEDLAAGRLLPVLPAYQPPEYSVSAIYPQSRRLSAKVRSFIDFVAQRLDGTRR